jgi:hypothetical protein
MGKFSRVDTIIIEPVRFDIGLLIVVFEIREKGKTD